MSGFEFSIPDDFLKNLVDTSFEEIAEKALTETAPDLQDAMKSAIKSAQHGTSTGELENSIKVSKPKKTTTDAVLVSVNPTGNSKKQYSHGKIVDRKATVSNVEKAIYLNSGTANQAPSPWLTPAINKCKETVMVKMQKVWEDMTKE